MITESFFSMDGDSPDLPALRAVCAQHDVWLHVDGAYGAPAVLLLDAWETARAGLARADSIALDPHKWLYAPVDAGLILFRDEAAARDTFNDSGSM